MRKLFFSFFLALIVVGCAAPAPQLLTPSGNPEVTIQGGTKKQVIDRIVNGLTAQGMKLKNVNDYGVTVTKRADDFASKFIYGSRRNSVPELRMMFTVIESNNSSRVFAIAEMVTNPGTGDEHVSDVTADNRQDLQILLENLKKSF